jgi:hypothetical protein
MSEKCYYCGEYTKDKCAICDKLLCDDYDYDYSCGQNNQTEGNRVSWCDAYGCPFYLMYKELICKDCIRANGKPGIILHTEKGDHYVSTEVNSDKENGDHRVSTEVNSDKLYGICIVSALLIGFITGYVYK